jgi:hypothetical protein
VIENKQLKNKILGHPTIESKAVILKGWTWSKCILGEAYALAGHCDAARELLEEITHFCQKVIYRPSEIA